MLRKCTEISKIYYVNIWHTKFSLDIFGINFFFFYSIFGLHNFTSIISFSSPSSNTNSFSLAIKIIHIKCMNISEILTSGRITESNLLHSSSRQHSCKIVYEVKQFLTD